MSDKKILVGDISRETAIGILKLMLEAMEVYDSIAPTPQRRNAVQMAISSLETDEAYDLMYEQPEWCKDCISREQAIKEFCKQTCETPNCRFRDKGIAHASCDEVDVLKRLPSVLPKATKNDLGVASGLEKNSKKLENPTTKDNLGVDCISRKAVQTRLKEIINEMETIFADIREREVNDSVCGLCEYDCDHGLDGFANECPGFEKDDCFKLNEKYKAEWLDIRNLPSVTPQEPRWISVSEGLPKEHICDDGYHEPSKSVLVQMKSGAMHTARYWSRYDERWLDLNYPTTDEVIAWMPLPKAYREVEV